MQVVLTTATLHNDAIIMLPETNKHSLIVLFGAYLCGETARQGSTTAENVSVHVDSTVALLLGNVSFFTCQENMLARGAFSFRRHLADPLNFGALRKYSDKAQPLSLYPTKTARGIARSRVY